MEDLYKMSNTNTLISLAYIRSSDNPFIVVCNLIQYVLNSSNNNELRFDEIKNSINNIVGLNFPNHVITSCLNYLVRKNVLGKIEHGKGYKIKKLDFNITLFEQERSRLETNEKIFVDDLIDYVKKNYNKIWTKEEAYTYFTNLLLSDSVTESILNQDLQADDNLKHIQPEWYVKKYILELMENKYSTCYKYFDDVFNGKIVLNGLIQFSDYNQDKMQKFQGTVFYFDTKIILRVLNYSYPYFVETSRELLRLVKDEYKGCICVPNHIISEIKYALDLARIDMKRYGKVLNGEISYFQQQNLYSENDFKIAIDSLENTLNQYGFVIMNDIDWNSMYTKRYCINTTEIENYIEQKNPNWNKRAISNDVKSILLVNINRDGNYRIRFGGNKRLPIFVTSNYKLVKDIKEYTDNKISNSEEVFWTPYNLPLISEYDLTCRLWITSKSKAPISLNLFKSSYLFQQSDGAFYKKVIQTYDDVKAKHKYNIIDLDYERYEKLKDLVIVNTQGNLEEINDDIVAMSFEELVARESKSKDSLISSLTEDNNKKDAHIVNLKDELIRSYSDQFLKRSYLGHRTVLFLIKNSPLFFAIIGILLVSICETYFSQSLLSTGKFLALIPVLISIIFVIIDKILDTSILIIWQEKYIERVKKNLIRKIEKQLPADINKYKKLIIDYCIGNTSFFK